MPVQFPSTAQRQVDNLVPSLQVGSATGTAGLVLGAAYGLFKSPHPVSFALASGVTTFLYGSGTFFFRAGLLTAAGQERTRSSEMLATGGGGAFTGALIGLTHRSIYSVIRTSALVGVLGLASQAGYHAFISPAKAPREQRSMVDRVAATLPFRSIPDAEYEERLNEKIAQIDAEIVVLDDRIANLRRQSDSQDQLTP